MATLHRHLPFDNAIFDAWELPAPFGVQVYALEIKLLHAGILGVVAERPPPHFKTCRRAA